MHERTNPMMLHRNWFRPRAPRTVDKIGVAVALAFLVAMILLAGGRGDKPEQTPVSTPAHARFEATPSSPDRLTMSQASEQDDHARSSLTLPSH